MFGDFTYELLRTVFLLARENHRPGPETGWKRFMHPFLLSQVSHEWRVVTLAEKQLWDYIYIDDKESLSPAFSSPVHYRLALDRARDAPLDVEIRLGRSNEHYEKSPFLHGLLSSLRNHALRCRSFKFASCRRDMVEAICNVLSRCFTQLTCLELVHLGYHQGNCINLSIECPHLRDLTLLGFHVEPKSWALCSFPAVNSMSCSMGSLPVKAFSMVLPSLMHLHVRDKTTTLSVAATLPSVRSMSFLLGRPDVGTTQNTNMALNSFIAPELRVLLLKFNVIGRHWGVAGIMGMKYPKLNTLILNVRYDCQWDGFKSIVQALRHVQHWVIETHGDWFPRPCPVERMAHLIKTETKSSGLTGVTITVPRPSLQLLKYYLHHEAITLRLYKEDFDTRHCTTAKELASLQQVLNVEMIDRPYNLLMKAVEENDPEGYNALNQESVQGYLFNNQ